LRSQSRPAPRKDTTRKQDCATGSTCAGGLSAASFIRVTGVYNIQRRYKLELAHLSSQGHRNRPNQRKYTMQDHAGPRSPTNAHRPKQSTPHYLLSSRPSHPAPVTFKLPQNIQERAGEHRRSCARCGYPSVLCERRSNRFIMSKRVCRMSPNLAGLPLQTLDDRVSFHRYLGKSKSGTPCSPGRAKWLPGTAPHELWAENCSAQVNSWVGALRNQKRILWRRHIF
jgi:hypothetical protein